ncbi:LEAF RUST 10 DISEASE-RESISTANCE LOCUS RECEPTOR-LIKE PROTEIN KINASE-like 1.2 isoform X3 [Phragmites australis]|uniref:LEAF RUST 10 DISEASE-RESISTANCE LOCUS RECEPTOR-LIKE PROTEIN KINASE-like 1.2 isoform X3 n=1 Tax=Phragmites australis TaxID=29695 RepID=UPI002D7A3ACC|nr:LEAF RUST 10 DISEASE-RESISTANCE LOCUS RECEPTOR-LIKE PROTEIN KINASE-like 1.2 isoform X3 [Phragmites australis]
MRPPRLLATMAHLPRCPVLVFLFLVVHAHVPASHGASLPPTYDRSMCSESFWCGDVDIHYPFYLSNTTEDTADYSTSFSCGYTDLKIFCREEGATKTPIIHLGGDNYTVQNIFYDNSTIILADSDALSGGSCPRVRHNVSFGQEWLHNTSSYDNLTFFFGCYATPSDPAPPRFDKYKIDCAEFNNLADGGVSFVFTSEEVDKPLEHELSLYCKAIVTVPVRSEVLTANNIPSVLTSSGYGYVLRQGFELAWNPKTTDLCYRCEQSGGGCAYGRNGDLLGCLCNDGKVGNQNQDCKNTRPKKKTKAIIAGVVGGFFVFLVAGVTAILFIRKRKRKEINSSSKLLKYSGSGGTPRSRGGDMESGSIQDLKTHLFSYEELEEATDCFNDNRELGDGGFGTVYKGYLKDGRVVAVKRLYNNSYRRVEQFVNEAAILSRLRHPSLVMFYGCTSSQSRELLLVYEFVANGTVADHLHGHRASEHALSWPLRLSIAVESAAALTYLHAIEPPIVHRDVKTTNILLDSDFHVKVADFGLSRLFPLDVTHVSTAPQGTPGYVDPEYHQCYQLTDKSDVYSFGVVLVELISSKPAVDITRHRNEINLAYMAINKIQKCQLEQLVDLGLGYEADPATKKAMTMVAELAFRCLQQNGEMRPPIKEVLEGLKAIQDECRMETDGDKNKEGPFSPNTVHAPWDSRATTPNTSQ